VASLSQGRTAAAQCGLFTYKSVPVIFEPPCIFKLINEIIGTLLITSLHGLLFFFLGEGGERKNFNM